VTVIAATNRPDIIDQALMRPGRFDRLIFVPMPDALARRAILQVHTRVMPLNGVNIDDLVSRTEGFVGADLENLCQEAGIAALREDRDSSAVEMRHFEAAFRTARPSVDKESAKHYETVSKNLHKARGGIDDLGIFR